MLFLKNTKKINKLKHFNLKLPFHCNTLIWIILHILFNYFFETIP